MCHSYENSNPPGFCEVLADLCYFYSKKLLCVFVGTPLAAHILRDFAPREYIHSTCTYSICLDTSVVLWCNYNVCLLACLPASVLVFYIVSSKLFFIIDKPTAPWETSLSRLLLLLPKKQTIS